MPEIGMRVEIRNETFRQLRPICIDLSQTAHSLLAADLKTKGVEECLTRLREFLRGNSTSAERPFLDSKLADYAFFPVSQVLKASQKVSVQCLGLCLECTTVLVQQGWQGDIAPPLAAQLMILCTLLAQDQPNGFSFSVGTPDLQVDAFACLRAVGKAVGPEARDLLRAEANFPQLGHTISVTLHGVDDAKSPEVQIAAVEALDALIFNVLDQELCAGFLPGIVSKLTRVLAPTTKQRRNPTVLIKSLEVLTDMITTTLKDDDAKAESPVPATVVSAQHSSAKPSLITSEWKQSTASQLATVLVPVMRLVSHSRDDVKAALGRLGLVILGQRTTLRQCANLALETAITLYSTENSVIQESELQWLLRADSTLTALLQTTLYQWLDSLTTILQSSDPLAKGLLLERIYRAYTLLLDADAPTHLLDKALAGRLRDGVIATLQASTGSSQQASLISPITSLDIAVLNNDRKMLADFGQPLVKSIGQEDILRNMDKLIAAINTNHNSSTFASSLAREIEGSHGDAQVANFWLLLTSTKAALQSHDVVEKFLNLDTDTYSSAIDHLEQLYGSSILALSDVSSEPTDPRLKELALRTLSLRAQVDGQDFRYELIDSLYPVLHTLASPHDQLQHDSMTTLDTFAASCGYDSIKQMIVENVDYLTNAIALKLNAFDVSPQAAQVLLMMVRLAGPSVLPYLEDIVETIFGVLENYHGYPLLVELLFKVLSVIAEEGSQAPQLSIADGNIHNSRTVLLEKWQPMPFNQLQERVEERAKEDAQKTLDQAITRNEHPERPWQRISYPSDVDGDEVKQSDTIDDDSADVAEAPDLPPAPRSYALLLRIADLTQHFLPSASPTLRTSLLALIRKIIPAIARHENSFLPLINTLWPEIVSRLDDQEKHVQAMSLDIIGLLCECAGDFMRSRITSLWPRIVELHHEILMVMTGATTLWKSGQVEPAQLMQLDKAVAEMQKSLAGRSDRSLQLLWDSLTAALTSIVSYTRVDPGILDQTVIMLAPSLGNDDVISALEQQNADALWLAKTRVGKLKAPFVPFAPAAGHWAFAQVQA
nr:tel2-interacting protein 1 [Quercus suber]